MKKLSIIIPFYNEEFILNKKITEIYGFCNKNLTDFELIFVDDGSTDSSNKIVRRFIKENTKNIILLSSRKNYGRGNAITLGMKKAKGNVIGYLDCDLQIKISYLIKTLKLLNEYDVVIASKFKKGAKVNTPFLRKLSSLVYNYLTRIIIGSRIKDHQAGFKFFRRKVVLNILSKIKEKGWLWDTEVLYLAQKNNYNIFELPIEIEFGYRKLRSSFFTDFIKLPFVLFKLKEANKKIYEKK
jgi:glycosyltransferase AglD